jgi:SAM-dependent methyltransferase
LNPEFDSFAEDYDGALNQGLSISGEDKNFFARGRIRWTARCAARMGVRVESLHDFGCGTGSGTPFFYEFFPDLRTLTGTDVSARSLDVATRTFGQRGTFRLMEQFVPDGSADLVYCNGVFHHIPPDQRPAAMKYIFDCLRPGGVFGRWGDNPWNPPPRPRWRRACGNTVNTPSSPPWSCSAE